MKKMLDGLTVIDITNNIAGPGCAGMMADHGANVIHVEKPIWGDDSRHFTPMIEGTSMCHCYNNRGKKSLVLDLKDPVGIQVIKQLAKTADVLIESNRPGVMARLGLDYESIRKINPEIIYCSISAFGQKGPYAGKAGYDIIAQAYSGMMYYTGEPGDSPVKNYFSVGDFVAAYNAYGSVMTALYHKAVTGQGQYVDVCLARSLLTMNQCISDRITGVPRQKTGRHDSHLCPYGIFHGPEDSTIIIAAINVAVWEKLCRAMDRPDLMEDPRFRTNDQRCLHQEEVNTMIEQWLASMGTIERAVARLDAFGVPNIKVYTVEDILNDEHANACGWIREFPLPPSMHDTAVTCPGAFGTADFSQGEQTLSRAPELGEHTVEILMQCGMTQQQALECEARWNHK